jgi:hypothetical protein
MKRALLASVVVLVALAGCAAEPPAPTPTPTTSATAVKPTPKPTPTTTLPPLAIPDCETLLPLASAKALFGANTEFLGETPAGEYVGRLGVPSEPVVLSTASPARACRWGVPNSDGVFSVVVAGITDAEQATLQAELLTKGYAETSPGTFQLAAEGEASSLGTTQLFSGDSWIIADMTTLDSSAAVAGSALDALRTANPDLAL